VKSVISIYKVTFDTARFRTLSLRPEEQSQHPDMLLNGRRLAATWVASKVYCPDPEKPAGDFYYLAPQTIVLRPRAYKLLNTTNYYYAEELPLDFPEERLVALNIMPNINCFDRSAAEFETDPSTGKITAITKYAFHPRRVIYMETTLFKIPEMDGVETFCHEGVRDRELGFRYRVEKSKLQGLQFEKVFEFPSSLLR